MKAKRKKTYYYLQYCCLFLVFLFMTYWNYITPLWNDDEGWTGASFIEIVNSSIQDYFTQNGRFIGQVVARSLTNLPLSLEAVLNAGVFCAVSFLILKLSTKQKNSLFRLVNYIFILSLIFLQTPGFSQVYLWRPGAGNYLWLMLIDLLFMNMFLAQKHSMPFLVLLTLVGFITGTTNENTVGGIIIICLGYLFLKRVDKTRLWPIISLIVGYIVLLRSPGDTVRAHADNPGFFQLSLAAKIGKNLVPINDFIIHNLVFEIVVFIILLGFNLFIVENKQAVIEGLTWFIAGLLTWYVLVVSPGAPSEPQTYYGGFVLTLVANAKLFAVSINSEKIMRQVCTVTLLVLCFFTFINLSNGFIDSWKTDYAIAQRNAEIHKQKREGHSSIRVKPLTYYGKSRYAMFFWQFDISNNPENWTNKSVAHRYNVKKVYLDQ